MSETKIRTWKDAIALKKLKPGKKKMINVGTKMVLIGMHKNEIFATEALCRHMRWPLAWGAKSKMIVLDVHCTKPLTALRTGN